MLWVLSFSFLFVLYALVATVITPTSAQLTLEEIASRYTKRTEGGIHLPIVRLVKPGYLDRRAPAASIGLGDFYDVVYSALVTIGGTTAPLIIDTGSSDLWVVSDTCTEGCNTSSIKPYPQATFKSSGLGIHLAYGDSMTGTFADGLIGLDQVDLAGITLRDQSFAAINRTNTTVTDMGAAGILGLSFPIISVCWRRLFVQMYGNGSASSRREFFDINKRFDSLTHTANHGFPSLSDILGTSESRHQTRQTVSPDRLRAIFASWSTLGPFVPRLVAQGALSQPMITVTLQRDTIDIGGNLGMLSLGELPSGVKSTDLTWAPLRGYDVASGGIPGPPDSPSEVYPTRWEVMIDNVYLDGEKLPTSLLTPSSIGVSALIDTGNSHLRGPRDIVELVYNRLGIFKCAEPHTLSFEIGGKMFPVDPRDFVTPAREGVELCDAKLVATDPPEVGSALFSWSLGVPFLKSVLSSYYFGNLTYPSRDPPRIGFLSTVPSNAGDLLKAAVASSSKTSAFPSVAEPAPSGVPSAAGTNSLGVPQATPRSKTNSTSTSTSTPPASTNGAGGMMCFRTSSNVLLALTMIFTIWNAGLWE